MQDMWRMETTYVGIDTTDGDGEHAVEVGVRPACEGDQITEGEDTGEETSLDSTTDETVDHRICLGEASARARQ